MKRHERIQGRISSSTAQSFADLRVEAREVSSSRDLVLATTTVEASGRFVLSIHPVAASKRRRLYFDVLDAAGDTLVCTKGIVEWCVGDAPREILLHLPGGGAPGTGGTSSGPGVTGSVLQANGGPVAAIDVRVFEKTLRHETLLGETKTNAGGAYRVTYRPKEGSDAPTIDLVVRAYDATGKELGASPTLFQAPVEAKIDVVIGGTTYRGPSEYETTARTISARLDGVASKDLTDADVQFLTSDTGLDRARVRAYADSARVAAAVSAPQDALYGLIREGEPGDAAGLAGAGAQALRLALTRAIGNNLVPATVADEVDATVAAISAAAVTSALDTNNTSLVTLGSVLRTSTVPPATQRTIVEAFADATAIAASATWDKLRAQAGAGNAAAIDRAQLSLQFGVLTRGHPPLVAVLDGMVQAGTVKTLADLASLDRDAWYALLSRDQNAQPVGAPVDVPGASETERRWNYATTLQRTVEEGFPTAALAARLARRTDATAHDLVTFFARNPGFEIETTAVDAYLKANPGATQGVADVARLTAGLKGWQRLARLTPRASEATALGDAGIFSAQSIVLLGEGAFHAKFDPLVGAARAQVLFANASHVANAASTLFARFSTSTNFPAPRVIAWPNEAALSQALGGANLPTYASLFGSLDSCACDDCRSVTSPAAYLVDTLSYFSNVTSGLRPRRPDIFGTELSCANTNTPMPYVDLVNEVLEAAVAPSPPPLPPALPSYPQTTWSASELAAQPEHVNAAAYATLTRAFFPWTLPFDIGLEEARVYLQHLGIELPALLESFASPLPPSTPNGDAIAAARLDLTAMDVSLITTAETIVIPVRAAAIGGTVPSGLVAPVDGVILAAGDRVLVVSTTPAASGLYAAAAGAWPRTSDPLVPGGLIEVAPPPGGTNANGGSIWQLLTPGPITPGTTPLAFARFSGATDVDAFVREASLSYDDLLDLLYTDFLNPRGGVPVTVQFNGTDCDLSNASLTNFGPTTLDRMTRFTRLRTKLGATAFELDAALRAFALTSLDGQTAFLRTLSELRALGARLGTPIVPLLSLWSAIDRKEARDGSASLYEAVFQNRTVLAVGELAVFAIRPTTGDLNDPGQPFASLAAHLSSISAALNVSVGDLAYLLDPAAAASLAAAPYVAGDDLSLANLSALYRATALAASLKLSVRDFVLLRALTATNPFDAANVPHTRAFVRAFDQVQSSAFSIEDLGELLLGVRPAPGSPLLTSDAAFVLASGLQAGLKKIASDNAVVPDPTGSRLRKLLAAALPKAQPTDLDTLMAIIGGSPPPTLTPVAQQSALQSALTPVLGAPAVAAIVTTLFTPASPLSAADRYAAVLAPLSAAVIRLAGEGLVTQSLASAMTVEAGAMRVLLSQAVRSTANPSQPAMTDFVAPGFANAPQPIAITDAEFVNVIFPTLSVVAKAALLTARFKLTVEELIFTLPGATYPLFAGRDPGSGWIDLNQLPQVPTPSPGGAAFQAWSLEASVFAFRDQFAVSGAGVFQIMALGTSPASLTASYVPALAELSGWPASDLANLVDPAWLTMPAGAVPANLYTSGAALPLLSAREGAVQRLGVSVSKVTAWISNPAAASADIRAAAKAKYDPATWSTVAKPLRDALRVRQRDALVAWLIGYESFGDANALFRYFLIDVEMGDCMLTSRMKQAIGSVQLFIQQIVMNLEQPLALTPEQTTEWTSWRGQYGLWQANREVFLYPENWLDPSLRDDKTPLFGDFENTLNQTTLTVDAVEGAFRAYLAGLDAIAHPKVLATYHDDIAQVIHVLARTEGHTAQHYYRTYSETTGAWSPWVLTPLDIKSDIVTLVVWNRRVHAIWGEFNTTTNTNPSMPDVRKPAVAAAPPPATYLEIRLAYSELQDGAWAPKRVTEQFFDSRNVLSDGSPSDPTIFRLTTQLTTSSSGDEDLLVWLGVLDSFDIDWSTYTLTEYGPYFQFQGWGGEPILQDGEVYFPFTLFGVGTAPPNGSFYSGQWLAGYNDVWINTINGANLPILGTEELYGINAFTIVTPCQSFDFNADPSFFFQDDRRCFFGQIGWQLLWWGWDAIAPGSLANVPLQIPYVVPGDAPPSQAAAPVTQVPAPEKLVFPATKARADLRVVTNLATLPRRALSGQMTSAPTSSLKTPGGPPAVLHLSPLPQNFHIYIEAVTFTPFYHPYACQALARLNQFGVDGLLSWRYQQAQGLTPIQLSDNNSYFPWYQPTFWVALPYPQDDIDVTYGGAYAQYNWELFFHAPLMIAKRLSTNQRFLDAQRWFHYIFDPTDPNQQYWKFLEFYNNAKSMPDSVTQLIAFLTSNPSDPQAVQFQQQVVAYEEDPFAPFAIARLRTVAFMKATVMSYLDNLIAWGDNLFRQNTMESINEATLLYVLASQILGERPRVIEPPATPQDAYTFDGLVAAGGPGAFGDPVVALENYIPSGLTNYGPAAGVSPQLLFFCVPGNPQVFSYWDTVTDRLTKIRSCMNIQGQVQQLPLWEPPLNPGALIRAAAAGLDLSSVLSDVNAPLPVYRFQTIVQKAAELVSEVRSLGQALLSALEKRDAEALAVLRSNQELQVLKAARAAKQLTVNEADASYTALTLSQAIATTRQAYYDGLTQVGVTASEQQGLEKMDAAHSAQEAAGNLETSAGVMQLIPQFLVGLAGIGGSPTMNLDFGGQTIAGMLRIAASVASTLAATATYESNRASTNAGHERRAQEWAFQSSLAAADFTQIGQQMVAASIRQQIMTDDLSTHDLQTQNASDVLDFLRTKFTNGDLYDWMVSQISAVYFQSYQLAYDLAKRAEQAFHAELRDSDGSALAPTYIQFGYWDSLKQGLLSGDLLFYDLKRMEAAYLDQNRREYEITRHVSLLEFDPVALMQLRTTGICFVALPESVFDRDYPGHYMRRLKTVALSIPCSVGPFTTVNATLSLVRHSIRLSGSAGSAYPRAAGTDLRFQDTFGAIESIVTSSGQSDGGLFETNLRDERYLPFEGAGAISLWKIALPADTNAFDTSSITDVVLHVRYTAREGGDALAQLARQSVQPPLGPVPTATTPAAMAAPPLMRLFLASQDFSDALYRFMNPDPTTTGQSLALDLADARFPFHHGATSLAIKDVRFFLLLAPSAENATGLSATLADPTGKAYPAPPAKAIQFQKTDPALPDLQTADFPVAPAVTITPWAPPGTATTWFMQVAEGDIPLGANGLGISVGGHTRIDPSKVLDVAILCTFG